MSTTEMLALLRSSSIGKEFVRWLENSLLNSYNKMLNKGAKDQYDWGVLVGQHTQLASLVETLKGKEEKHA